MMRQYFEQKFDILLVEPAAPEALAAAPAVPPAVAAPKPAPPSTTASAPAVAPPTPSSPQGPNPLELLSAAVAREDRAAVRQQLLTRGVDQKVCERVLGAWKGIATPGVPAAQRLAKMQELDAVIQPLTALRRVQDALWRLQRLLTKYT